MNIQELNEIIDIRKEELVNQNYSYNFYKRLSSSWENLLNFLMDNNLEYNEFTKRKFLENRKEDNQKYYNYVVHSINAIEGLDKIATYQNTQRLIRKERNYNHSDSNLLIINDYIESVSEYNSHRTIIDKKLIVNEIVSYLEATGLTDISKISKKDLNMTKNWYMKMNLLSNRKNYQWVLKDLLRFLYTNEYINSDFSILFDKFSNPHKKLPSVWNEEEIKK